MGRARQVFSVVFALAVMWGTLGVAQEGKQPLERDYNVQPVPFNRVHVRDGFWTPRLQTSRTVTIPYCFERRRRVSSRASMRASISTIPTCTRSWKGRPTPCKSVRTR